MRSQLIISTMAVIILATGCATPHVQPTDPNLVLESALLSFMQDGLTKRDEVMVKLGTPSAQFEGKKILTYQLYAGQDRIWHPVPPKICATTGLRVWRPGTLSLVLVFGEDGVLQKHSLVTAQ